MIRKSLQKFYHKKENAPHTYMGRISEVSLHRHRDGYHMLVSDVILATGEWITDHIWIRLEVLPHTIGLDIGDTIQFTGIVQNYTRLNGSMDFGIDTVQESILKCVEAN
jgi:hypothetical protein